MHFTSTIDTSRSRTRRIQFIILNFIKKFFCFNLQKKHCSEASRFKVGSSLSFSNLEGSQIIQKIRVRFKGGYLKQEKVTFTLRNAVNSFVCVLHVWSRDLNTNFTLGDSLFGTV